MFAARRDYILNSSLNWARNPQPLHHMYVLVFLVFLKTKKNERRLFARRTLLFDLSALPRERKTEREKVTHSNRRLVDLSCWSMMAEIVVFGTCCRV